MGRAPVQDVSNKRGEVEFRRKLFQQQVEGESVFDDEFDARGIEEVLRTRMADTLADFRALRDRGVTLSPFLEIGAERGQRALVIENDLEAEGAALDLSIDLLRSCAHYSQRFGLPRIPLRICADAYRLPFRSGSLPFVFCYQTLHHFPAIEPIIAEIHRVLAPGGHFFFAEEPYKRQLHVPLVRVKSSLRTAPRSRLAKLLRNLFVEESFNEEDMGVVENHKIPLSTWRSALGAFAEGEATLRLDRFRVPLYGGRNPVLYSLLWLLGGRIGGLYRKAGEPGSQAATIREALVSPTSVASGEEIPLRQEEEDGAWLTAAGERFPTEDGVAVLLPPDLRAELYPDTPPLSS
jgi:SAM-dependent methyltransferase